MCGACDQRRHHSIFAHGAAVVEAAGPGRACSGIAGLRVRAVGARLFLHHRPASLREGIDAQKRPVDGDDCREDDHGDDAVADQPGHIALRRPVPRPVAPVGADHCHDRPAGYDEEARPST